MAFTSAKFIGERTAFSKHRIGSLQAAGWLLHGAARQVAFTVRRDGVCEHLQRWGCGSVGAPVEDRLKVVGQQVMMLLVLFRDQVLGDTAERGNVSVRAGTKALPQRFAVCHAVKPASHLDPCGA